MKILMFDIISKHSVHIKTGKKHWEIIYFLKRLQLKTNKTAISKNYQFKSVLSFFRKTFVKNKSLFW